LSLISLVEVRKDFGIRTLFDNLTLHVGERERLGLIGPNGAGKSTLLRLLAGLEPPGGGQRRVLPQARIVLVSQEPEMDPERTVLEQVFAGSGEKMELLGRYTALTDALALAHAEGRDDAAPAAAAPPEAAVGAAVDMPQAGAAQFRERFESLLPTIHQEWPEVARHTLEATRGSFDTVVEVIARQTGSTSEGIKEQLLELVLVSGDQVHQLADSLRPLEEQLETLLDDLHHSLRPRIEKPVRQRPLMALGIAAGVGLITGLLLASICWPEAWMKPVSPWPTTTWLSSCCYCFLPVTKPRPHR